jgi:acetyl-CoA acyltransferase
MAAHCVDALLARNAWLAPARVDDCVIGCAFPEGPQGMNLGRNVAVLSRLGRDVAGLTISRYCASGLDAVAHAAARIASGQADAVVAGGVESTSNTLKSVNTSGLFNPAIRDRSPSTYIAMNIDAPAIPFWKRAIRSMGETAEIIARHDKLSRVDQDRYAWGSQMRTAHAQTAGVFRDEIVPITVTLADGPDVPAERVVVDCDDGNRQDTTPEVLAGLQPSFREDGSVTAGNAAATADGASCMLLASEDLVQREHLGVLGWFTGYASVGCEPELMAVGAVRATRKLLAAHRLTPGDIDLYEINEVFAAQILHCIRALELDDQRVNVNGGAISIGHPFGMTGARLVGHVARELGRRDQRRAVVAMCVGGGIGVAALIERAAA